MAKKETTGTDLVLSTNTPLSALDVLKNELNTIKKVTDKSYKTSKVIQLGNTSVNIETETKTDVLTKAYGLIISKESWYNQSQKALGIETLPVFTENGSTSEEWLADIKLRIDVITYESRKKELEDLIKEGEAFLTKEDQFKIYQAKLEKFVNK